VSSGGPIEGKQEGGPPVADRAGKGRKFPACEPRKGHCGSLGAKGQWGSPHEIEISQLSRELRVFTTPNPGNPLISEGIGGRYSRGHRWVLDVSWPLADSAMRDEKEGRSLHLHGPNSN